MFSDTEARRALDLRASAAFTLVEVVIAVGLVAFVLTAILGLVAIAANETKNADLKARLAWITEQVTSEYQSQRFSNALASRSHQLVLGLRGHAGSHEFSKRLFSLRRFQRDAYKSDQPSFSDQLHRFASGPNPVAKPATDLDKCQRHFPLQLSVGGMFA